MRQTLLELRGRQLLDARPSRQGRGGPGRPRPARAATSILDDPGRRLTRSWARIAPWLLALLLGAAVGPAVSARAQPTGNPSPSARSAGSHPTATPPARARASPAQPAGGQAARAPSGPVLGSAGEGLSAASEEAANAPAAAGADPLVSNGLGSPLCRGRVPEATLSSSARRNCSTSGFVASAAPTGNYGLDVHIDTGVLGLSNGGLMSALQDLLVTPLWMALVWVVHALCVMLEWCFTLNLLNSPASGQLGSGLRQMQQALTDPWIPLVLSVACVLVLYDGLIRRRVADTLGQALMMTAMMVGGLWAIADPGGSVGALGSWANEASLGTLAAAARGTPSGTPAALGQSMQVVFSAAVEVPWCYLEFGNVGWCREPGRTEEPLRSAALRIASQELSEAGCGSRAAGCPSGLGAKGLGLVHSAQLLREAHSNGAIFLALPANGPQRNSINDEGSLLRTICESSDATNCRGPAAAEAEFRTSGETWSRMGGLLLILGGGLGMVLLMGFIAVRLLSAALFSLFYLLIAPGDGAGSGPRGRRSGALPSLGRSPVGGRGFQAPVLVPARGGARRAGHSRQSPRARVVDAVAADVGLLVGCLPPAPPGAQRRPRGVHGSSTRGQTARAALCREAGERDLGDAQSHGRDALGQGATGSDPPGE